MPERSLISDIADGLVEAIRDAIDDIEALPWPDDPSRFALGKQDAALVGYEGRRWSDPREATPRRIAELDYTIAVLSHSQAHQGRGAEQGAHSALEAVADAVDGRIVERYVIQCSRDRLAGYEEAGGTWQYDLSITAYDTRVLEVSR